MILSGPAGFDAVTAGGYSAFTVSISTESLAEAADTLEQPELEDIASSGGAIYAPDPIKLACLRSCLNEVFQVVAELRDRQAMSSVTSFIERELPIALLRTLSRPLPQCRLDANLRRRALATALDFIAAYGKEPITVVDLCKAASCSLRTLNRAFHDQFGVSPKRYLMAFRLAGVHRSLLSGTAPHVGDAAAEWGFWHASKFTADYKRMFGELPSTTLSHRRRFLSSLLMHS